MRIVVPEAEKKSQSNSNTSNSNNSHSNGQNSMQNSNSNRMEVTMNSYYRTQNNSNDFVVFDEKQRVPDPDTVSNQYVSNSSKKPKFKKYKNSSEKNNDGYNSEDELMKIKPSKKGSSRITSLDQLQKLISIRDEQWNNFAHELKSKRGYIIKKMAEDGNCLFRSVADQVYGDAEMHDTVRERCMNYMVAERDHYSQFVTEDFDTYIARKRQDRCFGNHVEIQAMGELYNRPIEIFTLDSTDSTNPLNIFHNQYSTDSLPIRLSYHNGNHYNSVVDPNMPSVGVGLGLPNLQPGLADKMQMDQAMKESENVQMEELLMKQYQSEFDLEQAEKEIEKSILRQSEKEIEDFEMQQILNESRKTYFEEVVKKNKFS